MGSRPISVFLHSIDVFLYAIFTKGTFLLSSVSIICNRRWYISNQPPRSVHLKIERKFCSKRSRCLLLLTVCFGKILWTISNVNSDIWWEVNRAGIFIVYFCCMLGLHGCKGYASYHRRNSSTIPYPNMSKVDLPIHCGIWASYHLKPQTRWTVCIFPRHKNKLWFSPAMYAYP